jgi:hypothetical protein
MLNRTSADWMVSNATWIYDFRGIEMENVSLGKNCSSLLIF